MSHSESDNPSSDYHEILLGKRAEIDEIDSQLLILLNERASVSLSISALKRSRGVAGFDVIREHEIIARLIEENNGPLTSTQVSQLFFNIIETDRRSVPTHEEVGRSSP